MYTVLMLDHVQVDFDISFSGQMMHVQSHQPFPLKYSIRTWEKRQFIQYMFNVIKVIIKKLFTSLSLSLSLPLSLPPSLSLPPPLSLPKISLPLPPPSLVKEQS